MSEEANNDKEPENLGLQDVMCEVDNILKIQEAIDLLISHGFVKRKKLQDKLDVLCHTEKHIYITKPFRLKSTG